MLHPFPSHIPFPDIAREFGTPAYVLDLDAFRVRIERLKAVFPPEACDIFYSIKANPNPDLLRVVRETGLGVDACSAGDLWLGERCGFAPGKISFTGCGLSGDMLGRLHASRIHANLDSLSELQRWAALDPPRRVGLRVAPGVSAGFSPHCQGGEWGGKLGMALDEAARLLRQDSGPGRLARGLHMHIGSGILEPGPHLAGLRALLPLFAQFPALEALNIGGGFGTSYHDDEPDMPMEILGREVLREVAACGRQRGAAIRLQIEPGEFLAAPIGYLLATVMVKKAWAREGERRESLILDASMNHFPGGALYGSMNRMALCRAPQGPETHTYDVYGNTNQSGDRFGGPRRLPEVREGDLLVLGSCGAYAASRAATFNGHPLAPEIVVAKGQCRLSTRRQTHAELFSRSLK